MKPDIIVPTNQSRGMVAAQMCDIQGFSLGCRTLATCEPVSASKNRNIGLRWATSDIVIMVDDDICGFHDGWWQRLIAPLEDDPSIVVVSARLLRPDGKPGMMMFLGDVRSDVEQTEVPRVPTAAIAFRRDGTMFDEEYIGSGFEDDDFMAQLGEKYPMGRVVINNKVRLIHRNEMKNQHGKFYEKNKARFDSVWETSHAGFVRTRRKAPVPIPKSIHFIWLGSPVPAWAQKNIDKFWLLNRGWDVRVWKDDAELCSEFRPIYAGLESPHKWERRSDLLRISLLLKYGGWYFDTDFVPFCPVQDVCSAHLTPGCNNSEFFIGTTPTVFANGILGSTPSNDVLKAVKKTILSEFALHGVLNGIDHWGAYGTTVFSAVLLAAGTKLRYTTGKYERFFPVPDSERDRALAMWPDLSRGKNPFAGEGADSPFMMHLHMQGDTTISRT